MLKNIEKSTVDITAVSENFFFAKILAIFIVVVGHFFPDTLMWIPVTISLFIFAFSSGFFTTVKYKKEFSPKLFWFAKVNRLGSKLLIIDLFLFILFLLQGKKGIFTPQTLLHLVGLSGLVNWFASTNTSPFGAGLWFFTLLLIFYLFFPLMRIFFRNKNVAIYSVIFSFILTSWLHYYCQMEYMFWMTSFAFVFGVFSGFYILETKILTIVILLPLIIFMYMSLNFFLNFKVLNYFFMLWISIFFSYFILHIKIPIQFSEFSILKLIGSLLLEIYFIHTYLFVRLTSLPSFINLILSLSLIIITAFTLNKIRLFSLQLLRI